MKSAVGFKSLFILTGENFIRITLCKDVRKNIQRKIGKCDGVERALPLSWCFHRGLFISHALALWRVPSWGLDVEMHKRQVIPWLLVSCWHGFTGSLLGRGIHLWIKGGGISKLSFGRRSPKKERQEEK